MDVKDLVRRLVYGKQQLTPRAAIRAGSLDFFYCHMFSSYGKYLPIFNRRLYHRETAIVKKNQ
jgi:hypothetical protein